MEYAQQKQAPLTYEQALEEDLERSFLVPEDLRVRQADEPEKAATGLTSAQGPSTAYVIPYFTIDHQLTGFYRVRLLSLDGNTLGFRYRQPKGTNPYLYFPAYRTDQPIFRELAKREGYVIVTEGEKKAACAFKFGFPCVGLGGKDNWQTKIVTLPASTKLTKTDEGNIRAKITEQVEENNQIKLATGVETLIDFVIANGLDIVLVYDTDTKHGIKPDVQRSVNAFATELLGRGVKYENIKQHILPTDSGKIGLDDYLKEVGGGELRRHLSTVQRSELRFPRHPDIKTFLTSQLEGSRMKRSFIHKLSLSVLAELDGTGKRLRDPETEDLYYYNGVTHEVMPAIFPGKQPGWHNTSFGEFLYRRLGLGEGDRRILSRLASTYNGEGNLFHVSPKRANVCPLNSQEGVAWCLDDRTYLKITADGIDIVPNGHEGILFVKGQTDPTNLEALRHHLNSPPVESRDMWRRALMDVSFRDEEQRTFAEVLFHIAPWLNRWCDTQLPIEMYIGESGSGKSSICSLRLNILTGRADLRPFPHDVRDWYASLIASGGLHVTDNVHITNRDLRQKLSDEMCRLVTEPYPHVEMRKLYTTADVARYLINAVFVLTAIELPLNQADLMQRSVVFNLKALEGELETSWHTTQLERSGGREVWMAYHAHMLQQFFAEWRTTPSTHSASSHRLANFERCLMIMAKVLGVQVSSDSMRKSAEQNFMDNDWIMQGLKEFADEMRELNKTKTTINEICAWAQRQEAYYTLDLITQSRKLARFFKMHSAAIKRIAGIYDSNKTQGNRKVYEFLTKK